MKTQVIMGNVPARLWSRVDRSGGPHTCWLWLGRTNAKGYGRITVNGQGRFVHRVAYELLVGPIPDGLQIDHVKASGCTNRNCVNPEHLEPVTSRENNLRSDCVSARNAAKTHCPKGHPYDDDNTYMTKAGTRQCRRCNVLRERARAAAAREVAS